MDTDYEVSPQIEACFFVTLRFLFLSLAVSFAIMGAYEAFRCLSQLFDAPYQIPPEDGVQTCFFVFLMTVCTTLSVHGHDEIKSWIEGEFVIGEWDGPDPPARQKPPRTASLCDAVFNLYNITRPGYIV